MSKDIWHTADEYNYSAIVFPEDAIVVDTGNGEYRAYSSFYDMPHHCDDPDCCFAETSCWKRWAKLADLLALETELESTRKALDVAVDALNKINMRCQNTVRNHLERATIRGELCDISFYARKAIDDIDNLEQITALEQKDK